MSVMPEAGILSLYINNIDVSGLLLNRRVRKVITKDAKLRS